MNYFNNLYRTTWQVPEGNFDSRVMKHCKSFPKWHDRLFVCVEPVSLFIDGKIKIYVLGHEPRQHVTLAPRTVGVEGEVF